MSGILRSAAGSILAALAVLAAFFVWQINDSELQKVSFEKDQMILSDMRKFAKASNEFQIETGRYPDKTELMAIAAGLDFSTRFVQGAHSYEIAWIRPPNEQCMLALDDIKNDIAIEEARLCIWRGEWPKAVALNSDEHSFPNDVEKYAPSIWTNAFALLFGLASSFGSLLLFTRRRFV
ncbi:MAG: hypothetical protein HRT64_04565 [Erythrobacter sp.]|nr:hypothetical protein [Erythrobacter sp.]